MARRRPIGDKAQQGAAGRNNILALATVTGRFPRSSNDLGDPHKTVIEFLLRAGRLRSAPLKV